MFTRKFNNIVTLFSQILNYCVVIAFVLLLSSLLLWIINPVNSLVYLDSTTNYDIENISKYIIDHKPFGVRIIPIPPPVVIPRLSSQIKVTGIRYDTNKNDRVVWLEYDHKAYYLKENDELVKPTVILKQIGRNYIVISENGQDDTVKLAIN